MDEEQLMALLQNMPPEQRQMIMAKLGQQGPPQGGLGFTAPGDNQAFPGQAPGMTPGMASQGPQPGQQPIQTPYVEGEFTDRETQRGVISDEQARAQALMDTDMPQGIRTPSGFVASNPLSHIATGVKQWQGREAAKEALAEKVKMGEDVGRVDKEVQDQGWDRYTKSKEDRKRLEMQKEQAKILSKSPLERMAANQDLSGYA